MGYLLLHQITVQQENIDINIIDPNDIFNDSNQSKRLTLQQKHELLISFST